tara:strand:+ start:3107 stop:3277 length:171 start_codon:yes stop_codon:yes gene_type:complete
VHELLKKKKREMRKKKELKIKNALQSIAIAMDSLSLSIFFTRFFLYIEYDTITSYS